MKGIISVLLLAMGLLAIALIISVGAYRLWPNKQPLQSNYTDSIKQVNLKLNAQIDSLHHLKTTALVPVVAQLKERRKQLTNADQVSSALKHDSIVVRLREYNSDSLTALYLLTADVKLKALQLDSCTIENSYMNSKNMNNELQITNYGKLVSSYDEQLALSEKKLRRAKWVRNALGISSGVLLVCVLL